MSNISKIKLGLSILVVLMSILAFTGLISANISMPISLLCLGIVMILFAKENFDIGKSSSGVIYGVLGVLDIIFVFIGLFL